MFAQLGNIEFELLDIKEGMFLSRKYNYKEHAVLEGKSKLQYIGENLKKMQILVEFHADFCDPDARIRQIENEAAKHQSMSFVLKNGKYFGEFVIEQFDIKYNKTDSRGNPILIEAQINLKEHVVNNVKNKKQASSNGNIVMRKKISTTNSLDLNKQVRQ